MSNYSEVTSQLSFQRMDFRDHRDEIKKLWLELQSRTTSSYFQSWGWVNVWLDTIPENINVDFVLARKDGEPYCCFFMGVKKGLRHWFFYKTRAYLNETGDYEIDDLTIEYNMALGSTAELDWSELLKNHLFDDVEEIHFNNITHDTFLQLSRDCEPLLNSYRQTSCYYVDLNKIRESGKNHLAFLSSNKRLQIRRSLAYYTESGPIEIREAGNVKEALTSMTRLSKLHQARWTKKGSPGSFASSYFLCFHEKLIEQRFAAGEIQILEFTNTKGAIGYLYNLVQGNSVFYYQSGFNFESGQGNIARPGMVCHHLAIEYNLDKGRDTYNFLAGDSQFKRSLSTDKDQLHSVIVARNDYKWKLEKSLLAIKKLMKQ